MTTVGQIRRTSPDSPRCDRIWYNLTIFGEVQQDLAQLETIDFPLLGKFGKTPRDWVTFGNIRQNLAKLREV